MHKSSLALGATALLFLCGLAAVWLAPAGVATANAPAAPPAAAVVDVVPGMAPVADPSNLYADTRAGNFSAAVAGALERIYVPNRAANTVSVIDPATLKATTERFNQFVFGMSFLPAQKRDARVSPACSSATLRVSRTENR